MNSTTNKPDAVSPRETAPWIASVIHAFCASSENSLQNEAREPAWTKHS